MSGVYMWCDHCKKVMQAEFYTYYDIPDANVGSYEKHEIPVCPVCRRRMNDYANHCSMCREYISPKEYICECCKDDMDIIVGELAEKKNITREAVLDGMAEYLNM